MLISNWKIIWSPWFKWKYVCAVEVKPCTWYIKTRFFDGSSDSLIESIGSDSQMIELSPGTLIMRFYTLRGVQIFFYANGGIRSTPLLVEQSVRGISVSANLFIKCWSDVGPVYVTLAQRPISVKLGRRTMNIDQSCKWIPGNVNQKLIKIVILIVSMWSEYRSE